MKLESNQWFLFSSRSSFLSPLKVTLSKLGFEVLSVIYRIRGDALVYKTLTKRLIHWFKALPLALFRRARPLDWERKSCLSLPTIWTRNDPHRSGHFWGQCMMDQTDRWTDEKYCSNRTPEPRCQGGNAESCWLPFNTQTAPYFQGPEPDLWGMPNTDTPMQ